MKILWKYELQKRVDNFWQRLAWLLPKQLVKWCYIRVFAHGTQGQYGQTVVSDVGAMEILKRWPCRSV